MKKKHFSVDLMQKSQISSISMPGKLSVNTFFLKKMIKSTSDNDVILLKVIHNTEKTMLNLMK